MKKVHGNQLHGDACRDGYAHEYWSWIMMRQRCLNAKHHAYPRYGGRGITICDAWSTYDGFLTDMGRRPTPTHTLDRIDNEKNYGPSNCRWATRAEQNRNKRSVRRLSFNGKTATLVEWSKETGLPARVIYQRICEDWSILAALTVPKRRHSRRDSSAEA
jgi:hypothetical protein